MYSTGTNGGVVQEIIHGLTIKDPFRWLENQEADEVQAWVEDQNSKARRFLDSLPHRENLRVRLERSFSAPLVSVVRPCLSRERYFYFKRVLGRSQPLIFYRDGLGGQEEIAFDPNTLSEDGTTSVDIFHPSPNGNLLALCISEAGGESYAIRIFDLTSKSFLGGDINAGKHTASVAWLTSCDGFYYAKRKPSTGQGIGRREIYYHQVGQDHESDKLIAIMPQDGWVSIRSSLDGNHLAVALYPNTNESLIYLIKLANYELRPLLTEPGYNNLPIGFFNNALYIYTNQSAPNHRVVRIKLYDGGVETVVHEKNLPLQGAALIERTGELVLHYLENVSSLLEVLHPDSDNAQRISLPVGSIIGLSDDCRGRAIIEFQSFLTPGIVYSYDPSKNELGKFMEVENVINPEDFSIEQVFYTSKDGTKVPMYLVHRVDVPAKLDGSTPTLLTGYGGFNIPMNPLFYAQWIPFLEDGGLLAVANLRGGGEFGELWHKSGMKQNKQKVFDDFISAAEFLMGRGYTSREKLAIRGASNGGLLVAAVTVQRPELFKAVVCLVPLTDMIRYHRLLIGAAWVVEYGDPDNPNELPHLLAYSPYHNVKEGESYPPILIATSEFDARVHPAHAWKFAAALQMASPRAQILMLTHRKEGHGLGKPLPKRIAEETDILAFLYHTLQMTPSR